jgi:hypothetical protein
LFTTFVLTLEIFLVDLFAFAVGFCIISAIIAASRDSFIYITSGRTHLLASVICKWGVASMKSAPLLFIWVSNLIDVVLFLCIFDLKLQFHNLLSPARLLSSLF